MLIRVFLHAEFTSAKKTVQIKIGGNYVLPKIFGKNAKKKKKKKKKNE